MATALKDVMSSIKELPPRELFELKVVLFGEVSLFGDSEFRYEGSSPSSDMEEHMTEEWFSNGRACFHCGSVHVVRNGHEADGTQRYLCRDCNRTFVATTNSIAMALNLGRASVADIHSVFDGHIDSSATIVTDKMSAYVKFANSNGYGLVQIKGGRSSRGIYNVQRVNAYHGILKKFMRNFNGVSTKYLNNYLAWNNFVNYAREAYAEKMSMLTRIALTALASMTCAEVSGRRPLPTLE